MCERKISEELAELLGESRLEVGTVQITKDFDPLRIAVQRGVGRDFGQFVVVPRFRIKGGKLTAKLLIKISGLGQLSGGEFEELATPVLTMELGAPNDVDVGNNAVVWEYVL